MSQGNSLDTTVAPTDQVKARIPDDTAALDAAATKLLTGAPAAASVADAIEQHRSALHALNAACTAADVVAIKLAGGDTSSKTMAPLIARREAACRSEIQAFEALVACQPTDAAALADLLDYVAHSPAFDDLDSGSEALRRIAQGARRLAIYPGRAIPTEAVPQDGTILYEDASGKAHHEPISHWIAFMAQRMFSIARSEGGRQFRAHCTGLDQDGNLALDNHIRRTLRLDALHDLAFRSGAVFEAGKEFALGRGPVVVHASHDAEILALGREFDEAYATVQARFAAHEEAHARVEAFREEHTNKPGWTTETIHDAAWSLPGVGEAEDAYEEAHARLDQILEKIIAASARTPAGIAVKARSIIPSTWIGRRYEEDADLGSDEDWDRQNARSLIDACLSLAGVDWKGRAIRSQVDAGVSDLEKACDAQLARLAWLDQPKNTADITEEAWDGEFATWGAVFRRAIDEPSKAPGDLAAKARLMLADMDRFKPEDGGEYDTDDYRLMRVILREVIATKPTPQPMVDELLNGWAEWTKTDNGSADDAAWERHAVMRDALIDRAAALPATRENAPAKAIAQSWLEYVSAYQRDKPRGSYGIEGGLCLDIHDIARASVGGAA